MEESTNGTDSVFKSTNGIYNLGEVTQLAKNPSEMSSICGDTNSGHESSDDDDAVISSRIVRRMQNFSDDESEKENKSGGESDASDGPVPSKGVKSKSRIIMNDSSSDSGEEAPTSVLPLKNEEQQMRMITKSNKRKQKFEALLSSRSKHTLSHTLSDKQSSEDETVQSDKASDSEMSSISKIKQKIKKSMAILPSIYDPDTSDEENNINAQKQTKKTARKSTKIIDAKPMRMSAKQAMENMQLIKSESNRMLREKAVSLPYHRPKALSLKDIMSRRKPAIASDGKVLPIKMNGEQLRQYALQLEQRQKEVIELCKSESDDDVAEQEPDEITENPVPISLDKSELESSPSVAESNTIETVDNEAGVDTNGAINCIDTVPVTVCNDQENENETKNEEINQNDLHTNEHLVNNHNESQEEEEMNSTEHTVKSNEIMNNALEQSEPQEALNPVHSEQESQLISLHYTDSEKCSEMGILDNNTEKNITLNESSKHVNNCNNDIQDDFSDEDVNMEDIDRIIENAEIMKDDEMMNSPMLSTEPLRTKPKLTGAPGMIIDLDGAGAVPKRTGMEMLKERFTYFSKLKTPEELEREKEKMIKPGAQHLKLKQELEDKIAEQRSLEWEKRLEAEKQLHDEIDAVLDNGDEVDDSIEKIEAEIEEEDNDEENPSESEPEEELVENDIEMIDKPKKYNEMLDDEAEESDSNENEEGTETRETELDEDIEDDISEESNEEEESSESEIEEQTSKCKKGRILKAFEDSDDEDIIIKPTELQAVGKNFSSETKLETLQGNNNENEDAEPMANSCDIQSSSQDDVIQLAQRHKSVSEDLFTSQESSTVNTSKKDTRSDTADDLLGTQTFSISTAEHSNFLCPSQPYQDPITKGDLNPLPPNIIGSQLCNTQSQSQTIGEDILALCTGKFYDNEFVSTCSEKPIDTMSQDTSTDENNEDKDRESNTSADNISPHIDEQCNAITNSVKTHIEDDSNCLNLNEFKDVNKIPEEKDKNNIEDRNLLQSLIDELGDPEFDKLKANKFFTGNSQNRSKVVESITKKRLIIDSDDETNELGIAVADESKKKKRTKKKLEKRALQISDDEDENEQGLRSEDGEYDSDMEEDGDRVVEYDSEENEIEVKPDKPKKNRKATDFFEQEAELTSEDEWIGSGDEDEKGLDRMEREEGDDEVFHQGKLRRELGQIHMRDVLDQDKREVRLLQELLFEDGDLGSGHRQRKFRWRNAGDEETGTVPDDLTDTQEEEFESEEQWRKQRHEREVFLRQMQNQNEDEGSPNVTVNRTTIIKANLISKSMSTLLMEVNQSKIETTDSPDVPEKIPVRDMPSPKKSFSILQQKCYGSVLNRGRGALARLAALATPLAVADDNAPKIASLASRKRNFVFAALTPDENQSKETVKRKADVNLGTPKLVKKIRLEEKHQAHPKNSLLDHLKT